MDYYNKNINAIYSCKPNLVKIVNGNTDRELNVYNSFAKDGNSFMYVEMKDGNIVRINSMYSPINEAEIWAKGVNDNYDLQKIYIMFGLANGYCVRSILKKMNSWGKIIIYEPSGEIFIDSLKNYDLSDVLTDDRVALFVGEDNLGNFKAHVINIIGIDNIEYVHKAVHPQYDLLYKKQLDEFERYLFSYLDRLKVSQNTMNTYGRTLVMNQVYSLKNLKECNILSDLMGNVRDNDTAVIVAAGPSLAKNIDELKKAENNAFILAVDRTVDILIEHNIMPDVVVSVDPVFSLSFIKNEKWQEIPLMCSFDTNKDIICGHLCKRIYFDSPNLPAKILSGLGKRTIKLERGGSVATAAFMAVIALGFKNIILCGQDLAYGANGQTHSDGAKEKVSAEKYKDVLVKDIYGNIIKTRSDWKTYLDFYEDVISRNQNVNVIDATEGGAFIEGTVVMNLADAIEKYCITCPEVKHIVSHMQSSFNDEDLNNIANSLDYIVNDINLVLMISKKIIKLSDSIIRLIKSGDYTENNAEVIKFNQYIEQFNSCNSFTMILMYSASEIKDYIWSLYLGKDCYDNTLISMYEKYKYMFSALQGKLDELTKLIYN